MTFIKSPFFQKKQIESSPHSSKDICWLADSGKIKIDLKTAVKVEQGEVALIFLNQSLTGILENGTFPLSWIVGDDSALNLNSLEIYYFTCKTFSDQRWGTPSPILIASKNSNPISLRAHGTFSYLVDNPKRLWPHIPSHIKHFTSDQLIGELRSMILDDLACALNQQQDFARLIAEREILSKNLSQTLAKKFFDYGLKLQSFYIQSLSLPDLPLAAEKDLR